MHIYVIISSKAWERVNSGNISIFPLHPNANVFLGMRNEVQYDFLLVLWWYSFIVFKQLVLMIRHLMPKLIFIFCRSWFSFLKTIRNISFCLLWPNTSLTCSGQCSTSFFKSWCLLIFLQFWEMSFMIYVFLLYHFSLLLPSETPPRGMLKLLEISSTSLNFQATLPTSLTCSGRCLEFSFQLTIYSTSITIPFSPSFKPYF